MVTLLFPGQGSQYVGMGKAMKSQKHFLHLADEVLGYPLSKLMLEGPQEELTLTQNAQPAILVHSHMLYCQLKEFLHDNNIQIGQVLGHSVGEYSALLAAQSLSFEDAVHIVHRRGQFMQEAVPPGKGKMIALINVPKETIIKACQEISTEEAQVTCANFNGPTQTVISGHSNACDRMVTWLKDNGVKHRAVELNVSAPFHSPLMKCAAENLATELEKISFRPPIYPYIANYDARPYGETTPPERLRENLTRQVDGSVLWFQSLAPLDDHTLCIECGPGRILAGMARKINDTLKVIPLDQEEALKKIKEVLAC